MSNESKIFAVSVLIPPESKVEYYKDINLSVLVTNKSQKSALVKSVVLKFQSDYEAGAIYVDKPCGIEIAPKDVQEIVVTVQPDAQYLANSNYVDVRIDYSIKQRDGSRSNEFEIHKQAQYIFVAKSTTNLGKVFISFKQPEDLKSANLLKRFAERAGFEAYLAPHESEPGAELWERIEPAIKESACAFVIWGKRTDWGNGVRNEIKLCRKHTITEVLLLEHDVDKPDLYEDTTIEYRRFDPDHPAPEFALAISAARRRVLNGTAMKIS